MMSTLDLVLVGMIVLLIVSVVVWKFSSMHLSGANRSYYNALREWEQTLGVNDRYETPWTLMVGDDELAAPLLSGWGLQSSARPAWFGRWWYGPEGAVLVVPSALFNHGENASVQLKLWRQLLSLLVQSRARRPLDAVIWLCALEHLSDSQATATAGAAARRKFIDLQQRLGLSLPVYMIAGGGEGVPGLVDLVNILPTTTQDLPLGWTSPYDAQTRWSPTWITQAISQMQAALGDLILELGTLRGEIHADLFQLPQHLQTLHDPLQALCDSVFQGNALGEAPRLRGIWFCVAASAVGRLDPPGADLFAEPLEKPVEPPLFSRRLWRQRIAADQGLAQPIGRILQLRQRWQRVAGIGALLFGVLWASGMVWVWHARSTDADRLAQLLDDDQALVTQGEDDVRARQRINSFWHVLNAAPRWHLGTVLLPGSRLYGLDQKLDHELQQRAALQVFGPVRQRLQRDLEQLINGNGDDRNETDNSDSAWQQAQQIVEQAQDLERRSRLFNQSLSLSERPLDDIAQLANELFGLSLQSKSLGNDALYQRILSDEQGALARPLELDIARAAVAKRYQDAMHQWLDGQFASTDFGHLSQLLNLHLGKLQSGQRSSMSELEQVDSAISQLRQVINHTNAAWSQGSAVELTAGYKENLQRARQSSLIGPAVVEQIEQYAKRSKRTFKDHWLDRGDQQQSLLHQQAGGTLALQSNLEKLDQGIENLLREDFAQAALNHSGVSLQNGEGLRNIEGSSLGAALQYHASYQSFLGQQVAELPAAYRKGLLASARAAVNLAMWQRLSTRDTTLSWSAAGTQRQFDLPVEKALQLMQALADVGDNYQVELLRQEFNRRALNDMNRVSADLQNMPILSSPINFTGWDGTRNLALRSFREPDVPNLQQSMARQFRLIIDALQQITPAIDWINTQRPFLSGSDLELAESISDTISSMKKYSEQNPVSPALMYQQLVTREFNDMDMGNCSKTLAAAALPQERGRFAVLARQTWEQARQRCAALQNYTAAVAWQQMAVYFNTYLAGRFPFSNKQSAVDANPDRVREFLELVDKYLPDAYTGLQNNISSNSGQAADFLFNLQQARAWLGPMLIRDKEGLRGMDVEVRWRTDREEERGADQVIEWNMETGSRLASYPSESISHANWTVGEPVRLNLRWAQGSSQRPLDDATQSALSVAGLNASWSYEGPWALLRLIRSHQAINHFTARDNADRPLAIQLPLLTPNRNSGALMFLRLSLKAVGGKQPLVLSELPTRVPPSPYPIIDPLPEPITAEFKP